jgi:hypothetical protein
MPMEEWQEAPPSNGHSMDKSVRKNWKKCLEILPIIVFFFAVPPENTENRIFAQGGGLVLLNVSDSAEGIWTCQFRTNADGGQPLTLAEYALDVDGGWTNKWHNKFPGKICVKMFGFFPLVSQRIVPNQKVSNNFTPSKGNGAVGWTPIGVICPNGKICTSRDRIRAVMVGIAPGRSNCRQQQKINRKSRRIFVKS